MNYNTICNKYGTDKGDSLPNGNCYASFYENWFREIKQTCQNILEIGVDNGASLHSNYEYFPNAQIIGLDISDKLHFNNDRITTFILDQENLTDLENFSNYFVKNQISFDIILDDGSHDVSHQQKTLGKFFKLLKPGGIYIIEDLGTSYFTLGQDLYGYYQTQDKINNNTIKFLNQRPFYSPWILEQDLNYLNDKIEYVSIFDKLNKDLIYSNEFNCTNGYPIRSITSVLKKKNLN